jgi:tetratricopeptide (TPR) repeat protein
MWRWHKSTFVGLGAILLIGGCAKSPDSEPPLMLRQLARSYLIGVTYDQALIASQQEDARALRDRLNQLDELNATDVTASLQLSRAEDEVRAAGALDVQALQIERKNPALSRQMEGLAGQRYRAALRWSPQFPSTDPLLLNSLGYFLADRGATKQDFELAAQLTGHAVEILQQTVADNTKMGIYSQRWLNETRQQQAITQDSYAWALYKLKRFDEAETTQRQVLADAKSNGIKDDSTLAELWFHLAKILQAQGKTAEANEAMKEAQRLQPDIQKM